MTTISKNTEQVIIGGLLGDSCINKFGKYNPNLTIVHGPKQLEYLKWKYEFFVKDGLVTKKGIYSKLNRNKRVNKNYLAYGFYTKALPLFQTYRQEFYPKGKKKVTRHILNKLDPLGLAVWYMDDGSRNIHWQGPEDRQTIKSRDIRLNTQGFTFEEHEIIQQYFKVVWEIDAKIYKERKTFIIFFNSNNANTLIDIIQPHIIPSMQYKIDLMYNVTHPLNEEERKIRLSLGQSTENSIVQDDDIV